MSWLVTSGFGSTKLVTMGFGTDVGATITDFRGPIDGHLRPPGVAGQHKPPLSVSKIQDPRLVSQFPR